MEYYITGKDELSAEIKSRLPLKKRLADLADKFAKKEFGISDFSEMSEQNLDLPTSRACGVLCRQVATARIEEVCSYVSCACLNLLPMNFTFGLDTFSTRNADKVNLVKVRYAVSHSKNGQPMIRVEKLADPKALEGMILREIMVDVGISLPEYHRRLRSRTFGQYCPPTREIGPLFSLYLRKAKKHPPWVFEVDKFHMVKKAINEANLYASRPPASWYYPLYLANFISGNLVLFETYENKSGDVHKIKEDFRAAMDMIMDATGIYPMVVQTPPLDLDMMLINTALFESEWRSLISVPENFSCDTVELFSLVAKQAIAIGNNGVSP